MTSRPSWIPERLYPFESRYRETAGAALHYVDEGDGPPLLMLHGNPTWSFAYRELIAGLSGSHRCIAPDLPGFGLSVPPAGYGFTAAEHARVIERFVLDLDLHDVTLVCQDWGGPIGFWAATRHPGRFRAFVVGNTWAWPWRGARAPMAFAFSRALGGPVGRRLIANRNAFVEWLLPSNVRRTSLPDEVMDAYRGPFPTPGSRRPTSVFPHEVWSARPLLAEIEAGLPMLADRPALIVWPTKDAAFGAVERRRWEQVFPDHRTVLLEGAGHYITEDAPDELVAAIREWEGRG